MRSSLRYSPWLLFGISFLARIPFLWAGYGREEDAWSQAFNARIIADTGVYEVSRLPGHPVYELLLAMLWPVNHQFWFFNSLSALVSAISVVILYRILKTLSLNAAFITALAFGFIPVFFIAGTYTIDYNFAVLLILWSWLNLQKGRIWFAALAIGLATGFRISSLAFVLPLSIATGLQQPRQIARFFIASGFFALICFLPPLLQYGIDVLNFHKPPFPGWASIIYKLTFGIWGIPLLLGIIALKAKWLSQGHILGLMHAKPEFRRLFLAAFTSWILCFLVFARLPFKAEFFIPSLAFFMVLMAYLGSKREMTLVLITSLLSCFSFGFDYANPWRGATPSAQAIRFEAGGQNLFFDPWKGPAIIDHSKRINKSKLVGETLRWAEAQSDSSLVIAGWYWPEIELKKASDLLVKFDYYSTREEMLEYRRRGYHVYYLPEINEANHLINAHYLADSLGQVLHPL